MARRTRRRTRTPAPHDTKKRGIYQNSKHGGTGDLVDKVADFSYESDALAQLIVEYWLGDHHDLTDMPATGTEQDKYLARSALAKAALAAKGVYLFQPIVITEKEYDDGFSLADAGITTATTPPEVLGVVLVVPDGRRATTTVGGPLALLETAKMLMAVTPNGI